MICPDMSVALLIEGGPGALSTVKQLVQNGIPVVVLTNTGRLADILQKALSGEWVVWPYIGVDWS